jgi:hypothetical protein
MPYAEPRPRARPRNESGDAELGVSGSDTIGQQVRDVPTLEKCFGHDDEVLARVEPVSNARGHDGEDVGNSFAASVLPSEKPVAAPDDQLSKLTLASDTERFARRALDLGLDDADTLATLSEAQRCRLVLLPGLSTATTVSETSGRGVGVGAVLEAVEAAGGSLENAAEGLIAPVRLLATPAWCGGHSW